MLTTLRRGGYIPGVSGGQSQSYYLAYDGFGNTTSVSVGSRTLARYTYGASDGNLTSLTYGNGDTVSYGYDSLGRVTEESWNSTLKYRYGYNSEGYLAKKIDAATGKAVNYEYDSLGRLIRSYASDGSSVTQRTEHIYDTENRLSSQSWTMGSTTYGETFYYSSADSSLTKVAGTGFADYVYAYDAL